MSCTEHRRDATSQPPAWDDGTTTPKLLIDKKVQSFDLLGKAGGHDHEGCLPICDRCLLPNATGTTKAEKQFWIFDTTTLGSALNCCSTNRGGGGLSQEDNCGAYLANVTDRPENTS
uniref:Uncharacterized protein n=1 Tax=Gibberella zeae TaxID=5518 RepID=A0A4E9E0I4_GIBZA